MATIRYIDENGQWQEIAVGGGGGGSTDVDISAYFTKEFDEYFDDTFMN